MNLVRVRKTAHARHDAEDIVVHRVHAEVVRVRLGRERARAAARLAVEHEGRRVDAGEVAGARRLVLFGLQGKRVYVDRVRNRERVVGDRARDRCRRNGLSDIHNVRSRTSRPAAVPNNQGTRHNTRSSQGHSEHEHTCSGTRSEDCICNRAGRRTRSCSRVCRDGVARGPEGAARVVLVGLDLPEVVTVAFIEAVLSIDLDTAAVDNVVVREGGRVSIGNGGRARAIRLAHILEHPDQLLDRVVQRQVNAGIRSRQRLLEGVLQLVDEVLVRLLGKATTLIRVQVDVVNVQGRLLGFRQTSSGSRDAARDTGSARH